MSATRKTEPGGRAKDGRAKTSYELHNNMGRFQKGRVKEPCKVYEETPAGGREKEGRL